MHETIHPGGRPWKFTIVRAHGLQRLRVEKSWRPVVMVTVVFPIASAHAALLDARASPRELSNDIDTSSRIDICIYHRAESKKKNKRRNLVANTSCTLQDLARLQAQQECKHKKGVEITLNSVLRQKGGSNKAKSSPVLLVAKLDLPEVREAQSTCVEEELGSDTLGDGSEDEELLECSSPPSSESGEDPSFAWPEVHDSEPKVVTGYWSDSDRLPSEDERDPLVKHRDDEPIVLALSDSEDNPSLGLVKTADRKLWFAASILPSYTETISIESQASTVDSIVDSFSPYRELREAQLDSDYERVLTELRAEWRFVGGSLVALAGLEAGVFGFSSASAFLITHFARRAIAVGSVASGLGLTITAWFLLLYSNATSPKFQRMAMDVYGTYMFFCISARIPALCMFTSAFALMTFLLSVAWTAWPTAVLVMSFMAGVLISLQFIVYGVHCVVVLIAEITRNIRKGVLRFLACIRPPPPDVREKPTPES